MRFHFDLTNGQTTMRDQAGAEADNLAEAIEQARIVIEELRVGGALTDVDDNWTLVIRGADGAELQTIPIETQN